MKKTIEAQIITTLPTEIRHARIDNPVMVNIEYYEPNMKRDKDNIAFGKKFILDSLVAVGVLKNDGWRRVKGFQEVFICTPKQEGKVVVTLIEEGKIIDRLEKLYNGGRVKL